MVSMIVREKREIEPYTMGEVKLAIKTQEMLPYHRELMVFLVKKIEEMEQTKNSYLGHKLQG